MHALRKVRQISVLSAMLAALLACNLGAPSQPTAPPETPASPEVPTEASTEAPLPDPLVVTYQDPTFSLYQLDGTLVETRPADGMNYPRPNTAQVGGQDVFYVYTSPSDFSSVVRRVSSSGSEDLAFTASDVMGSLSFAVSPDGSRIAWAQTISGPNVPFSRLWVANIDGSGQTLVADSETETEFADYFVLEPVTWLANGDLVYAWQITGIGGYILFFGWSSLYQYSPDTAAITPLAPLLSDSQGPCWSGITSDGAYAVSSCGGPGQMLERATATGVETLFPLLADQGQAGAGAYSPSGDQLAYGIARSDYNNEAGQVILVASRGGAPVSIASHAPGYFHRIFWVAEDRMVVGVSGMDANQMSVDLLRTDGTRTPIGEGTVIGLMTPAP